MHDWITALEIVKIPLLPIHTCSGLKMTKVPFGMFSKSSAADLLYVGKGQRVNIQTNPMMWYSKEFEFPQHRVRGLDMDFRIWNRPLSRAL